MAIAEAGRCPPKETVVEAGRCPPKETVVEAGRCPPKETVVEAGRCPPIEDSPAATSDAGRCPPGRCAELVQSGSNHQMDVGIIFIEEV